MEKCRLLMVRGGNSRKKADKDLQEKQLFSFQTIKLLKSEALRSPRSASSAALTTQCALCNVIDRVRVLSVT